MGNLSTHDTERTVAILQKHLGACTAFILPTKLPPSCIIIFTRNTSGISGSNLVNTIFEQTNVRVVLLLHKLTDLSTKQKSQQHFFHQVLHNAQRLALDKNHVPYILNHKPERDLETDTRFWHKCVAVAQFNIQAAKDSPQQDVTLCKIALLNRACVQVALGLIRVYLGYTPNEFGLHYLLQLCGHFTDLPMQVFDRETPEAVKRYKMLCAPPSMLLHWTKLYADENDFEILMESCQEFLDRAGQLATDRLNRLQTLTSTL